MTEDKDYFQENAEFRSILARYERMVRQNEASYFDVYQFEKIVDHYLDGNYFDQATKAVDFGIRQHPSATSLELKRAQIFAEKGDSSKALTLLKKLEKTDASNNELFLIKGMVYSQLGKTAEAEKTFDKALAITYENKEEILYDIAISYENNHQYKIALKYLKKALKIKPGKLNIIYEAAHCYERLHEYNNAAECYKKYLDKEPFAENVWYNLGTIYFKKEDFTLAVEAYDYAIALNDTYSSAYLNKAITLSHWGKYKEAVSVYLEFLQMEPQNVMAHCYLGECFERLEKFDDAIQWYQKAIDLDPDFSEAWFGLAICYQHKEDYVKALKWVDQYISTAPSVPWQFLGHQLKGFYLYILGDLGQAFKEIDKSEELAKKVNDSALIDIAYRVKIWICYEWGKIDLFREYQKIRMDFRAKNNLGEETENNIISKFYEGLADLKTGQIEQAKSKLSAIQSILSEMEAEKAKQIKTTTHDYLHSLILLEEGSADEAIALIEKMPPPKVSFSSIVSFVRRNLPFDDDLFALAFLKKGEMNKAIAEYERMTSLNLEIGLDRPIIHPLSRYRLAKLYEETGQKEKAIEQYAKALETWKTSEEGLFEVGDARERLENLIAQSSKKLDK